jgi:hypothetical protein
MTRLLRAPVLLLAVGFLSACVYGRKIDYQAPVELSVPKGSTAVAVAILDHRPYVVSGAKSASFVGSQRSGFPNPIGLPHDVNTESGAPLATDFSRAIAKALTAKGFSVTEVNVAAAASADDAVALMTKANVERSVLLEIKEWRTDTLTDVLLYYDLSLGIFDNKGVRIAQNAIAGRDDLTGFTVAVDYAATAGEVAPEAFKRKMTQLFDKEGVAAALTGATP